MSCCAPTRCDDRVPLPDGGWACRTALRSGRLTANRPENIPDFIPATRQPGWSRGALLPCPRCGCRAHSAGPGGLPERRCWACNETFNPELEAAR